MRARIPLCLGAAVATVMFGALGWTGPQHSPETPSKASSEAPSGRILWQYETGG
jgi:hypothetical protein